MAVALLGLALTLGACGPAPLQRAEADGSAGAPSKPGAVASPKTLVLGFDVFPSNAQEKVGTSSKGAEQRRWIFTGYLTGLDKTDTPRPMLAEEVPSVEKGTWTVQPDGTMETIWKIRPTARWHDGTPITVMDFVFALEVYLDREIPTNYTTAEAKIARIDTIDDRTMSVRWKEVYFQANSLSGPALPPLPAHVVEPAYRADKQEFLNSPFWTSEYVGSGPFRVEQWDPVNKAITGVAHDGFALGRPRVDRIRIEFLEDSQVLVTRLLAGTIDVAMSIGGLPIAGAQVLRDSWEPQGLGSVGFSPGLLRYIAFQLKDVPGAQPAMRDRTVRQALAHATDREAIAQLAPGLQISAHYPMSINDPFHRSVDRVAPKYRYEPALAERMLEDAGYRKEGNGIRRGGGGERFEASIWASAGDSTIEATVVADNWKRVGVDAAPFTIPNARASDREYQAGFPAAEYKSTATNYNELWWTTANMSTAASRWVGRNRGGYSNPEADVLARRIVATVDRREREGSVVELMRIWADDVPIIPVIYNSFLIAAAAPIGGYDKEISPAQAAHTWNIYRWTKE